MDKNQAVQLIRQTFEGPFDRDRFRVFVKNLLNMVEDAPFIYRGKYIPDAYDQYVSTLERIGRYTHGRTRMDILVVTLKKTTSLERARTMQRNFIAWYLNGSRGGEQKDAALAAFVSPDEEDWRFSLVKMDYRFDLPAEQAGKTAPGRIKVKEEFTPARRWSFLVGVNEKSHTAQSRLVNILADTENNPSLERLEQAFNIEVVTREFFDEYLKLFLKVVKELDRAVQDNPRVRQDFEAKNIDQVNFAKKLLGQIIFLYFLQKKGWFGVGRDETWGRGSKIFLRELFSRKHAPYNNFFNDILEPLFYDALSIDRSHINHYNSRFNCRIPFLNGGLFDPISGYDWVGADIFLPDELFSNSSKTSKGDLGDGILDVFDRFNFTVREDEPLEREVAIDPELLGKAYEKFNAIRWDNFHEFEKALGSGKRGDENKFNRQFGVFYTPRHFVHYMCRQSIIHYLHTELSGNIPLTNIETLIHLGEQVSAHEARIISRSGETAAYSHKLPASIRDNAALIDEKLSMIRVCDPAVGSGAFPVGMMIEIVRARTVLSVFIDQEKERSEYDLKRHCIEYCLFGVDIDSGAVEVAKLRLWLSLVVDEEDFKNIKPLPNLDYKVYCGNSLICAPEHAVTKTAIAGEIEKLRGVYFSETNPGRKQELQQEIDKKLSSFFEMAEKAFGYRVDFDFRLIFSEVFREKNGFDVMIGNPPYIQLQKDGGRLAGLYSKLGFQTFQRTGDIYALFYEKGIRMLKPGGHLCFITSSKWMRSGYGKSLRRLFSSYNPVMLISLGPGVFESATVDTNILIIQKEKNRDQLEGITLVKDTRENSLAGYINENKTRLPVQGEESWFIGNQAELRLKDKIERLGTPLKEWDVNIFRGVLTGLNAAFIVDTPTRDRLVAEDSKNEEILKPILRGRDIERYNCNWAGLWLLFIPWHFPLHDDKSVTGASGKAEQIFIEQYPGIYRHLYGFKKNLSERNKAETSIRYEWYALQRCAATYHQEFEKEKVVWIELVDKGRFAYVEPGIFTEATTFLMTMSRPKYFVGCLNSRLINWHFNSICASSGMGTNRWKKIYVELLPIPQITPQNQPIVDEIESLVDRIIEMKKQDLDTSRHENQIDQLVYRLYDLTPEEIGVVEG
jgi:hypothetical protein